MDTVRPRTPKAKTRPANPHLERRVTVLENGLSEIARRVDELCELMLGDEVTR